MIERIPPQDGQESVWDYPRPPHVEATSRRVRVVFAGQTIADSRGAYRVLETSHPPVYYIPQVDIQMQFLRLAERQTFCEYKGKASYWSLQVGGASVAHVAWSYPHPMPRYVAIQDHLAFYPARVDACFVDDEQVQAQVGDFYGGWITSDIVGPFKGGAGTWGW